MNIERVAEQAVLGALLSDPERYDDVREWLEVDDFDGTNERLAYAVIVSLHQDGGAATPEAVNEGVLHHEPRPLRPADGVFLAECMEACPAAERAAVYGRMVLESSIRRRIGAEAAGLRQRAEQATTTEELNRVFFTVDRVRREVEYLHAREAKANGWHTPTPATATQLGSIPRSSRRDDASTEQAAVLALIAQPTALATVGEWLSPDDFNDLSSKVMYAELQRMHRASMPIDSITAAWSAAQVGLADPVVHTVASQTSVGSSQNAVQSCREVLERSVKAHLVDTAQAVEHELSERPQVNGTGQAHTRLNALWPGQRRLVEAARLA